MDKRTTVAVLASPSVKVSTRNAFIGRWLYNRLFFYWFYMEKFALGAIFARPLFVHLAGLPNCKNDFMVFRFEFPDMDEFALVPCFTLASLKVLAKTLGLFLFCMYELTFVPVFALSLFKVFAWKCLVSFRSFHRRFHLFMGIHTVISVSALSSSKIPTSNHNVETLREKSFRGCKGALKKCKSEVHFVLHKFLPNCHQALFFPHLSTTCSFKIIDFFYACV